MKKLLLGFLIFVFSLVIGVMAQSAVAVKANSPPIIKEKAVPCYRASVTETRTERERKFRVQSVRDEMAEKNKDKRVYILPFDVRQQPRIVQIE